MTLTLDEWLIPYITQDKDDCTHLFLDGGKAKIPFEKEKEFIRHYSNKLDSGGKVYIVEKRPDVFRYMIDVDILDKQYWELPKVIDLAKIIQKIIFEFYEMDLNVICCMAPPKIKGELVKTGIHLIWPRHFINCEDALTIREALLIRLEKSELKPQNSWNDILDELIYIRNGYRMVGSDKMIPGTKISENRPYTLKFVMDSKGELREVYRKRLSLDSNSLILDTSIRFTALEGAKLTIPFKKIPKWLPVTSISKSKKKNGKLRILGTLEYEIIQKFMDSSLPSCYNNQTIKDIRQYPDGNFLIITDSSYCLNIQRNHNSCGIYFLGTRKGIYQKCLCPCDNLKNRINGYCKNYTSQCFEFTKDTSEFLFPRPEPPQKYKKKHIVLIKNLSASNQTKSKYLKHHLSFCETLLK